MHDDILAHFRKMAGDGSRLEFVGRSGGKMRVKYEAGANPCSTCVLTPEDLGELLLEVVSRKDPSVVEVEVTAFDV